MQRRDSYLKEMKMEDSFEGLLLEQITQDKKNLQTKKFVRTAKNVKTTLGQRLD